MSKKEPIRKIFDESYEEWLRGFQKDIEVIAVRFAENPDALETLGNIDDSDPVFAEVINKIKSVFDEPADNPEEKLKAWFTSYFHDEDNVSAFYVYWQTHVLLPAAQHGAKVKKGRSQQNAVWSEKRKSEWEQYGPWLDAYFKRNPTHSITDGRKACAKHFDCSPKTIQRRTKGYKKPSV